MQAGNRMWGLLDEYGLCLSVGIPLDKGRH